MLTKLKNMKIFWTPWLPVIKVGFSLWPGNKASIHGRENSCISKIKGRLSVEIKNQNHDASFLQHQKSQPWLNMCHPIRHVPAILCSKIQKRREKSRTWGCLIMMNVSISWIAMNWYRYYHRIFSLYYESLTAYIFCPPPPFREIMGLKIACKTVNHIKIFKLKSF